MRIRNSGLSHGEGTAAVSSRLAIHDFCRAINVEPFHPTEVSEDLSLALGTVGFADDLGGVIHRHSAGNPLFVTALVRDLLANGIVARDGATWTLTVPVERIEPAVPATLQDCSTFSSTNWRIRSSAC